MQMQISKAFVDQIATLLDYFSIFIWPPKSIQMHKICNFEHLHA